MNSSNHDKCDSDWCPCPVLGCPYRHDCRTGTKSHLDKGHLNACGYYTIRSTVEKLISMVDDPETKALIKEMLIDPNEKPYSLCRIMQDKMPISDVVGYLSSPVQGLRCNAHESLKRRTGLDADYDPLSSGEILTRGVENWRNTLMKSGFLLS